MIKSGLAFHCHHDILSEYVYDYDERVKYIKEKKLASEQELRLKLFQLIPKDKLPGKDSIEWKACNKAQEACNKAQKGCDNAQEAYYFKYQKEIDQLHNELCPDCPFDRKTIFTRKDRKGRWY